MHFCASAFLTHLSNRQDVEQGLEQDPEHDKAKSLGIPEGFKRGQRRGEVGQAGVLQVDLEYQEENPGWQEEQPEVCSWRKEKKNTPGKAQFTFLLATYHHHQSCRNTRTDKLSFTLTTVMLPNIQGSHIAEPSVRWRKLCTAHTVKQRQDGQKGSRYFFPFLDCAVSSRPVVFHCFSEHKSCA